jgi:hypothetical protein
MSGSEREREAAAAEWGLIAQAAAVLEGCAMGLDRREIARCAHDAGRLAHDMVLSGAMDEPSSTVGHHHGGGGGGGGHHHHHGHGGRTQLVLPVAVDTWADEDVVLACGEGQIWLGGECVDLDAAPAIAVGSTLHGRTVCRVDGGLVALPDGSMLDASTLDWSMPASVAGALVGAVLGSGGSPTHLPTGQPTTPTTPTSSGNAEADALNLQWQALAQVIGTGCLGTNPTLPAGWSPDVVSQRSWLTDYQGWKEYYAGIGSFGWEDIVGDIKGWQADANGWGQYVKEQCPTAKLPANFPTGTAGLNSLVPSASSIASTIQWVVIAVAVGVGLWLLWPVLVGARGLAATL